MTSNDEPITARDWVRRALSLERHPTGDLDLPDEGGVGELELAPFQRRAVERGLTIARRYGGVLLADAVGLGKTRVSLGIARNLARESRLRSGRRRPALFCVPARLRDQWRRKAQRGGFSSPRVVSHTALSRQSVDLDALDPSVVVADEAHRFRNPDANRSRELSTLCSRVSVVLATATPVCNSIWDLYHLLSLFVAEHDLRPVVGRDLEEAFDAAESGDFDLTALVEHLVIRRTRPPDTSGFGRRPSARLEMLHYDPDEEEQWVWRRLEPTLRDLSFEACADQWPPELFIEYALRRWESGPRALADTLTALVEYHRRWLEARRHERSLDRDAFGDLFDDASAYRQEVFPFLFPDDSSEPDDTPNPTCIRRDLESLESLLERVETLVERDLGPSRAIVELAESTEDKILIFTEYRRAARGLFETLQNALGSEARIGLVTGDTARATGLGRTSTHELLSRFAPRARDLEPPPFHQQIRILVATDCLSRGVNLQDCGRVVLADLPYSPLAVEQRIGRLLRPGGPHETVHVYIPRPHDWNDTLGLRRRLRRKLSHARRSGTTPTSADTLDLAPDADDTTFEPTRDDLARPSSDTSRSSMSNESDSPVSTVEATASTRASTPTETISPGSMPRNADSSPSTLGLARIAHPTDPETPLAALTRLDGLARQLEARDAADVDHWWATNVPIETSALWIRTVFERDETRRCRWGLVVEDGTVELRTSRLVRPLVALADARLQLSPTEPPSTLVERAHRALEARCKRLEAARLAPVPLDPDAPQRQWWQRLRQWHADDRLSMSRDELTSLRQRLLRPVPRGIERHLLELLEGDPPPSLAVRRLAERLERPPAPTGTLSARIASGLHLRPTSPRRT
jgi:superfamily II DNA or RNA helicase